MESISSNTEEINNLFKEISEIPNLILQDNMFLNTFTDITYINKGGEGYIYKAKHIIDNKYYAIKKIPFFINTDNPTEIVAINILNKLKEVRCMSGLDHPNIIKYYTSWIEANKSEYNINNMDEYECDSSITINDKSYFCVCLFVQMELMELSLRDFLQTYDNEIKKNHIKLLVNNILDGVRYLHTHDIIHRDLKPENVLLKIKNNQIIDIKIADFSLVIEKKKIIVNNEQNLGTPTYTPPENVNGIITKKYDIYSLGIILFEIINNFTTFMETYIKINELKTGQITKQYPLLYNMVHPNYNKRPHIHYIIDNLKIEYSEN